MEQQMVLLTGATGFLGSHLLKMLLNTGYKVVVLKRSTSDVTRISKELSRVTSYNIEEVSLDVIFSAHNFEIIIHTATNYGRGNKGIKELVEANITLPLQLLHLSVENNVSTFINTDTALPATVNDYSLSKKQFLEWMNRASGKIRTINIIPEYFYGEGDDLWKLIPMIIDSLKNNKPTIDFTSGNQKRDFIYISDLVDAYKTVLLQLEQIPSASSFSVGSGFTVSIKELAVLCKELSGNKVTLLNWGAIPDRLNDYNQSESVHIAIQALGWKAKYSLSQGLQRIINNSN